jgi:UDPglucose--hexose-1-phosphate uridylyltransferase
MFESPHWRLNPLTGEWVLVSPHRSQRPFLGEIKKRASENRMPYDPTCYLCPGNDCAGGEKNPRYIGTFVFNNDFAALIPPVPLTGNETTEESFPLFNSQLESEHCRVICFSPRHDLTLPELSIDEIELVIKTYRSCQ